MTGSALSSMAIDAIAFRFGCLRETDPKLIGLLTTSHHTIYLYFRQTLVLEYIDPPCGRIVCNYQPHRLGQLAILASHSP